MTVEELLSLKPGDRVFVIPALMPVSGTERDLRYDDTEVEYSTMAKFFGRECTVANVINNDHVVRRDSSYVRLEEDPDGWSWFSEMIEFPFDSSEIELGSEDLFDMEVDDS